MLFDQELYCISAIVVEQTLSQHQNRELDKAPVMLPFVFNTTVRERDFYLSGFTYLGRNKGTHPPTSQVDNI